MVAMIKSYESDVLLIISINY